MVEQAGHCHVLFLFQSVQTNEALFVFILWTNIWVLAICYAMHSARGWKDMKSSHSGWCWKCEIPGRLEAHKNHIIKIQIIKFCKNNEGGATTNSDWGSMKSLSKKSHLSYISNTYQAKKVRVDSEWNLFKYKELLLHLMSIY